MGRGKKNCLCAFLALFFIFSDEVVDGRTTIINVAEANKRTGRIRTIEVDLNINITYRVNLFFCFQFFLFPSIKCLKFQLSSQLEDGDVIDCVDIYKQPAFDDPLFKDHIIQVSNTCSICSIRAGVVKYR